MNEKSFYDTIRKELFHNAISIPQMQGIAAILVEYRNQNINDLRQLAYIYATIYHETRKTMQPIKEDGQGRGYDYGKKLDMGTGPGHRIPYIQPDKIFYGRGFVQTTWLTNYRNLTTAAHRSGKLWDFVNFPELLLQMEPSVWATFYGMKNGIFTGRKLSEYFNSTLTDFVRARYIINGKDQRDVIAGYAGVFYKALTAL